MDESKLIRAYNQRNDVAFDAELTALGVTQENLETALLLTVSWLKKFQDRFDALGDGEFGTFAYGHRQYVEKVLQDNGDSNPSDHLHALQELPHGALFCTICKKRF